MKEKQRHEELLAIILRSKRCKDAVRKYADRSLIGDQDGKLANVLYMLQRLLEGKKAQEALCDAFIKQFSHIFSLLTMTTLY